MNGIKKYNIPIKWESWRIVQINAPSLEDAKTNALNRFSPNEEYISGSLQIDEEEIQLLNDDEIL